MSDFTVDIGNLIDTKGLWITSDGIEVPYQAPVPADEELGTPEIPEIIPEDVYKTNFSSASAGTYYTINDSMDFIDLTIIIDTMKSKGGGILHTKSGSYDFNDEGDMGEFLLDTGSIILRSAGGLPSFSNCKIDFESEGTLVESILFQNSKLTIDGVEVSFSDSGFSGSPSEGLLVKNGSAKLTNPTFNNNTLNAIKATDSSLTISNAKLNGNPENGLLLDTVNLTIDNSEINGNSLYGIDATDSTLLLLDCNVQLNGIDGLKLKNTICTIQGIPPDEEIPPIGCEITNNVGNGITVDSDKKLTIKDSNLTGNTQAIQIDKLAEIEINNASLSDSKVVALNAKKLEKGTFTSCSFSSNNSGVIIDGGEGITFERCDFNSNYLAGIKLIKTSGCTFNNCKMNSNTENGIHLYKSEGNTFTGCITQSNTFGVYLESSDGNTFGNLNTSGNRHNGVRLFKSNENKFETVTSDANWGDITFEESDSNELLTLTSTNLSGICLEFNNSKGNSLGVVNASKGKHGIYFHSGSKENEIKKSNFYNMKSHGIYILESDANILKEIVVEHSKLNGAYLVDSKDNEFGLVECKNSGGHGCHSHNGSGNKLALVKASGSQGYGTYITNSKGDEVLCNENNGNVRGAIKVIDSKDVKVISNKISVCDTGNGIEVFNSSNIQSVANIISGCSGNGMYFENIKKLKLVEDQISLNNASGILIRNCSTIKVVKSNLVGNKRDGLAFISCSNIAISESIIDNNGKNNLYARDINKILIGTSTMSNCINNNIDITVSKSITLTKNTITGCGKALFVKDIEGKVKLDENIIENNVEGFHFHGINKASISLNQFINNSKGIYMISSSNNKITNNGFIDNVIGINLNINDDKVTSRSPYETAEQFITLKLYEVTKRNKIHNNTFSGSKEYDIWTHKLTDDNEIIQNKGANKIKSKNKINNIMKAELPIAKFHKLFGNPKIPIPVITEVSISVGDGKKRDVLTPHNIIIPYKEYSEIEKAEAPKDPLGDAQNAILDAKDKIMEGPKKILTYGKKSIKAMEKEMSSMIDNAAAPFNKAKKVNKKRLSQLNKAKKKIFGSKSSRRVQLSIKTNNKKLNKRIKNYQSKLSSVVMIKLNGDKKKPNRKSYPNKKNTKSAASKRLKKLSSPDKLAKKELKAIMKKPKKELSGLEKALKENDKLITKHISIEDNLLNALDAIVDGELLNLQKKEKEIETLQKQSVKKHYKDSAEFEPEEDDEFDDESDESTVEFSAVTRIENPNT